MTRRPLVAAVLAALAVTFIIAIAVWRPAAPLPAGAIAASTTDPVATPWPIPIPGHEVYGYVPYWEMDDGIAAHLAQTPLTTLALFSVTQRKTGELDTNQRGYKRITGDVGSQLIREAHDRGVARRARLHELRGGAQRTPLLLGPGGPGRDASQALVALAERDSGSTASTSTSSRLDVEHVPAYGAFVGAPAGGGPGGEPGRRRSRSRRRPAGPGAAMAAAASDGRCRPDLPHGLRLPLRRAPSRARPRRSTDATAAEQDLAWSLDLYQRSACRPSGRSSACRSTGCAGRRRARGSARPDRRRRDLGPAPQPRHARRPADRARARPDRDVEFDGRADRSPCRSRRRRAGRRSTSTRRPASGPSWRSRTSAASPAPGSGRSAMSAACPTYTELIGAFRDGRPMAIEPDLAASPAAP